MGFTNIVGTGGVLELCLCLGCGNVGGVGGVGAWTRSWEGGWCYFGVFCEYGSFV